ncbi:uncharacterized protein LOC115290543 [Suricata suricatta]|uniref:uncharacterized protein LOC115290543 n=1 Tax=Suricata suricatta TaxID=37032 RepID=UPI0011555E0B|nr:uncharacterized protein LOC115290543 [Suricata suricatta]
MAALQETSPEDNVDISHLLHQLDVTVAPCVMEIPDMPTVCRVQGVVKPLQRSRCRPRYLDLKRPRQQNMTLDNLRREIYQEISTSTRKLRIRLDGRKGYIASDGSIQFKKEKWMLLEREERIAKEMSEKRMWAFCCISYTGRIFLLLSALSDTDLIFTPHLITHSTHQQRREPHKGRSSGPRWPQERNNIMQKGDPFPPASTACFIAPNSQSCTYGPPSSPREPLEMFLSLCSSEFWNSKSSGLNRAVFEGQGASGPPTSLPC